MAAHNFSDFVKSVKFGVLSILGLSLVIAVHETGHFFFSKIFSIDTPIFSIGFGPRLFQKTIGSTNFVIAALPLGGYVQIAGMRDNAEEEKKSKQERERLFFNKPYYQKLLVLLGGILFNLLFAYFIFFLLFLTSKNQKNNSEKNDTILGSIKRAYSYTIATIVSLQGLFKKKNLNQVGGPLAVIAMGAMGAQQSISTYFLILALISVNLAIINLLPLPILDGGQILLYTIEAIRGKSISPEILGIVNLAAWFFIIFLMLLLSVKDIRSLFGKR
jgi:regulator of sigma E protease